MTERELKALTARLLAKVVRFAERLPPSTASRIFSNQIIRCDGSVGANYRAACRARSDAEMVAKLGIVEEEADECKFWLEACQECGLADQETIRDLWDSYDQIVAMMVASKRTLKRRLATKGNSVGEQEAEYDAQNADEH